MAKQDDLTIAVVQANGIGEETTKISSEPKHWSWTRLSAAQLRSAFPLRLPSLSRPGKKKAKQEDNWREWSRFKLWRRTRPFSGSILIMLAGLLVLWGPIELLPFALLPGSNIWAGLLVGGLLFVMGLIQLLVPSNALVTGSAAVVLSLVSLPVAAGGLGLGMLLGIIGGAMGVAWQPVSKSRNRSSRSATNYRLPRKLPEWMKKPFPRSH